MARPILEAGSKQFETITVKGGDRFLPLVIERPPVSAAKDNQNGGREQPSRRQRFPFGQPARAWPAGGMLPKSRRSYRKPS